MKTSKTENSERKIYIPKYVAQYLAEIKKGQDELKEVLGNEYMDYNLVMATTFGMPINLPAKSSHKRHRDKNRA